MPFSDIQELVQSRRQLGDEAFALGSRSQSSPPRRRFHSSMTMVSSTPRSSASCFVPTASSNSLIALPAFACAIPVQTRLERADALEHGLETRRVAEDHALHGPVIDTQLLDHRVMRGERERAGRGACEVEVRSIEEHPGAVVSKALSIAADPAARTSSNAGFMPSPPWLSHAWRFAFSGRRAVSAWDG
jgi:hypothetical protein